MRLVDYKGMQWQNRAHFFAVSAQLMRRILVEHARRHNLKRGGGVQHVSLEETAVVGGDRAADLVALDDAMDALARLDPRKVQVVEMRFFGGLSVEETAEVLKVSPVTVMRDWSTAKAWLYRELTGEHDRWTLIAGNKSITCCRQRWSVRPRSAMRFCRSACAGDGALEREVRSLLSGTTAGRKLPGDSRDRSGRAGPRPATEERRRAETRRLPDRPNHFALPRNREARRRRHGSGLRGGRYPLETTGCSEISSRQSGA